MSTFFSVPTNVSNIGVFGAGSIAYEVYRDETEEFVCFHVVTGEKTRIFENRGEIHAAIGQLKPRSNVIPLAAGLNKFLRAA
jgi:hypothetical protein